MATKPFFYISVCLYLSCITRLYAQHTTLRIHAVDTGAQEMYALDNIQDAYHLLRQKQNLLLDQGFLACSIDSIAQSDTLLEAWMYRGTAYQWATLSFSGLPESIWTSLGLSEKNWSHRPVSIRKLAALHEKILTYCENNGYPFAYTYLDSFQDSRDGLDARMCLSPGPLTRVDTLIVESEAEISPLYLQNYLGIHQGDLYNESQFRLINKRLAELPFAEQSQPWEMDFTMDKNKLHLYLKEKKANQLNGLIGLQPNTEETGKFMLTADFLLGLKNSLGYGETINATFQNLQYQSPRFHADAIAPYIFGTAFALEGSFDLYKKDSTYRQLSFEGGIRYQLNAEDYIKVVYQNTGNRLITPDTNYVRQNKKLPENLDTRSSGFGIAFQLNRTDYRLNPRKGWQAYISASGLIRKIIPNDAILSINDGSGFDYSQLYTEANTDKYQYRLLANAAYYIPLLKNIVGKISYQGGYISGQSLFQNELYQIGGFKTLRGFDEAGIYASQYHIGTLEIHFLFSRNAYFYLFNDNAYTETRFTGLYKRDYPVSLGTGVTLENKSGIFNIALGLGKHSGEIFRFRQAKIHFGYVAYF